MIKLLALVFLLVSPSTANAQLTGPATTKGTCSPANTGNNNTFTINCGIGREQGERLLAILNKILSKQIDPSEVMAKLDEILQKLRWELPRAQADQLVAALKAVPKGPVAFACLFGDSDGCAMVNQLGQLFAAAGWDFGGAAQIGVEGEPMGIAIGISDPSKVPAHFQGIEAAFKAAGIPVQRVRTDGVPSFVHVLVGHRPGWPGRD
jgi:hypothetical protein